MTPALQGSGLCGPRAQELPGWTAQLDGPGGTQVPQRVIDAVGGYYRDMNANSGGAFRTSESNDAMSAEAHAAVADLLGAASPDEIKFGANMTTLTFHIGRSIGATLQPGDEIVVTKLDHEANVSTWRAMAADRGVTVHTVDIDPTDVPSGDSIARDFQRFLRQQSDEHDGPPGATQG